MLRRCHDHDHENECLFSRWQETKVNIHINLAVSLHTTRFNIREFYMVLTLRSMFCTDFMTDSDFCFIHH